MQAPGVRLLAADRVRIELVGGVAARDRSILRGAAARHIRCATYGIAVEREGDERGPPDDDVFRYRVQAGDKAARGPTVARTISLGGGAIADASGNLASLAIAPPSLAGVVIAG